MSTQALRDDHRAAALPQRQASLVIVVLALGTAVVFLGVDMMLPSIPMLPAILGGTTAMAAIAIPALVLVRLVPVSRLVRQP